MDINDNLIKISIKGVHLRKDGWKSDKGFDRFPVLFHRIWNRAAKLLFKPDSKQARGRCFISET